MKVDQRITVVRLRSGLYKVSAPHLEYEFVDGAASTAMLLNRLVFETEASEVPNEHAA